MVAVRGVARYGRFAANDRNAARGSVWIHSTSRITQQPPDRQQLHSTTNVSSIVEPAEHGKCSLRLSPLPTAAR
jgi:hypothetical protein